LRTLTRSLAPLAAWLLAACGDSNNSKAVAPLDPPELVIARLSPAGGRPVTAPVDGVCVDLATDPDQSLGVIIGVTDPGSGRLLNWTLVPPYGCQGAPQCGYLRVTAETDSGEALVVDTSSTTATLPLVKLSSPLAPITIRVELRDDRGEPALDATGDPFPPAQVSIVREPRCGGEPPPIPDSGVITDSGPVVPPDAPVVVPDAPVVVPDAPVVVPDAPVVIPDGAVVPDAAAPTDAGTG
jgi:hypothetical protein